MTIDDELARALTDEAQACGSTDDASAIVVSLGAMHDPESQRRTTHPAPALVL